MFAALARSASNLAFLAAATAALLSLLLGHLSRLRHHNLAVSMNIANSFSDTTRLGLDTLLGLAINPGLFHIDEPHISQGQAIPLRTSVIPNQNIALHVGHVPC
jgi:hypothetical protein